MISAAVCPAIPNPAAAASDNLSGFFATLLAGTVMYSASDPVPVATLETGTAPHTVDPTRSFGAVGPAATTVPQKSKPGVGLRRKGKKVGMWDMRTRSAGLR